MLFVSLLTECGGGGVRVCVVSVLICLLCFVRECVGGCGVDVVCQCAAVYISEGVCAWGGGVESVYLVSALLFAVSCEGSTSPCPNPHHRQPVH